MNQKVLVIESDDWGSTRTDNVQVRGHLNRINDKATKDKYIQMDNLADENDFQALFEVLSSVKDANNQFAKITPNVCTANPDYKKIKENKYEEFYFQPFFETILEKKGDKVLQLWKEGVDQQLFKPQLHGREHLHGLAWLKELRAGNKELLSAFELESFGIPFTPVSIPVRRQNLQAALDHFELEGEFEFQKKWLKEGAEIFKEFFDFSSISFIAPTYVWSNRFNPVFKETGIQALQGIKLQYHPYKAGNTSPFKRKFHFQGERKSGMTYLVRNVFFEPYTNEKLDWVDNAMQRIEHAFSRNQPAVLGSHRINFIGSLEEKNRTENLKSLQTILKSVVTKWPDVVFMSSDELVRELNT